VHFQTFGFSVFGYILWLRTTDRIFSPESAPLRLQFAGECGRLRCNDPSAGSPTETLLRLLLPLNDKV
jgi:hypothetical protein